MSDVTIVYGQRLSLHFSRSMPPGSARRLQWARCESHQSSFPACLDLNHAKIYSVKSPYDSTMLLISSSMRSIQTRRFRTVLAQRDIIGVLFSFRVGARPLSIQNTNRAPGKSAAWMLPDETETKPSLTRKSREYVYQIENLDLDGEYSRRWNSGMPCRQPSIALPAIFI